MLKVHQIFSSIQGESRDTGKSTTFIRLFGCNLKCIYCDQPQEDIIPKELSILEISSIVTNLNNKYVCITGGEPMIQAETLNLAKALCCLGFKVSIETNGSVILKKCKPKNLRYVMDIKAPSSEVELHNKYSNLRLLNKNDDVKIVIKDEEDLEFVEKILTTFPTKATIILSPMFDGNTPIISGDTIRNFLVANPTLKDFDIRVMIQTHKILNVL